jgi:solute carrier family 15 oligopeptide transporter 1
MGAVYALYVPNSSEQRPILHLLVRENSVSVLWQIPQFLVITIGEVLFSVTGLEFSYSQASPNMKSVLQVILLFYETLFLLI